MTTSTEATAYLILSLLCAIINVAPTISHLKQGHSGPGAFGVWVVLLNACDFTNGLLWRNDAIDRAPVFCDISSKLTLVGPLGLLIANCCIIRYLAAIVEPNKTLEDRIRRRHRQFVDYSLAFGFPCFVAASSFLYQAARYQVNHLSGCSPVTALVWPTFMLSLIWPPIMCGIACGYSVYVMYWLVRRHRDLRQLVKSDTTLNVSSFMRMGALSATYLSISAPCTILGTIATLRSIGPYIPWRHWSDIHNSDNKLSDVRQDPIYELELRDWLAVFAGLTIFFFFSFAKESLAIYVRIYRVTALDRLMVQFLHKRAGGRSDLLPISKMSQRRDFRDSRSVSSTSTDVAFNPTTAITGIPSEGKEIPARTPGLSVLPPGRTPLPVKISIAKQNNFQNS